VRQEGELIEKLAHQNFDRTPTIDIRKEMTTTPVATAAVTPGVPQRAANCGRSGHVT